MGLDHQIIEALHIDGRVSWQRIAEVLDVHERTVARHGNALLESGIVQVVAISVPAPGYVVALRCGQGQARMTSTALSGQKATGWAHVVTGDYDVIAEVTVTAQQERGFLLEDLPALAGVREIRTYPVIEYLRLARWWNLGILGHTQRAALMESAPMSGTREIGTSEELEPRDKVLLDALSVDGRLSYEELGRRAGVSDVTAKRRVDAMRRQGYMAIRAVVDPEVLGMGVETLIWLEVPPQHVAEVAEGLRQADHIKYAARITGPWAFIIKAHIPQRTDLDRVLADAPWAQHITRTNSALALRTDKRSTVRQL